jgi:hypothetical protein
MAMGLAASPLSRRGHGAVQVQRSEQLDARADLHVVADGDRRDVERHQAEIREAPRADADLRAVIHVERRPDHRLLPQGTEQLLEGRPAQRPLPSSRRVVRRHEVERRRVRLGQLGVVKDVQVPGEHPLAHRPGVAAPGLRRHMDARIRRCGRPSTRSEPNRATPAINVRSCLAEGGYARRTLPPVALERTLKLPKIRYTLIAHGHDEPCAGRCHQAR